MMAMVLVTLIPAVRLSGGYRPVARYTIRKLDTPPGRYGVASKNKNEEEVVVYKVLHFTQ